mmetsp:Transcript_85024/g.245871  ORF Transcript_85024/g.245871 Transcript_85024/m.245871 type:complete len:178 (-) Transcript_85024:311-844(-)
MQAGFSRPRCARSIGIGPPGGDAAEDAPCASKLFGKVVNLIGGAAVGVHDAHHLVPSLVRLGGRHIAYGLKPEQFTTLGQALIATLRRCLGDAFTPEVEMAWTVVYGFVSASMTAGLKATPAAPALGDCGSSGVASPMQATDSMKGQRQNLPARGPPLVGSKHREVKASGSQGPVCH